jgi:hypothetical protein
MWFARFEHGPAAAWVQGQGAALFLAEDGSHACAYLPDGRVPGPLPAGLGFISLTRLLAMGNIPGAAHGAPAPWHYVVATDVQPMHEADFNAWYDTEHRPGLAAVPGTASAARFRVVQGEGPLYHACYDLAERTAFNSTPWLAVRDTAWSSRMRPAFFNTRRTMYRRLA